jgi:cystathionine beta-lyase/cystathionine gamma-synthase
MRKPSATFSGRIHVVSVVYCTTVSKPNLTASTVKQVYYPKYSETRPYYDKCRTPHGGYGGLLSVTFYAKKDAVTFFDNLDAVKGPSLGTNFTLRYVKLSMEFPKLPSHADLTIVHPM